MCQIPPPAAATAMRQSPGAHAGSIAIAVTRPDSWVAGPVRVLGVEELRRLARHVGRERARFLPVGLRPRALEGCGRVERRCRGLDRNLLEGVQRPAGQAIVDIGAGVGAIRHRLRRRAARPPTLSLAALGFLTGHLEHRPPLVALLGDLPHRVLDRDRLLRASVPSSPLPPQPGSGEAQLAASASVASTTRSTRTTPKSCLRT